MKFFKKTFILSLVAFLSLVKTNIVFAQNYVPLAPLPGVAPAGTSLSQYLGSIFKIGIGLAGVFAVLMIVIAGIEYIGGAGSPSARSDAKKRIWNAIFGLLLALGSWLIINVINPDLLDTGLTTTKVAPYTAPPPGSVGGTPPSPSYCFDVSMPSGVATNCFGNESSCMIGIGNISSLPPSAGQTVISGCYTP